LINRNNQKYLNPKIYLGSNKNKKWLTLAMILTLESPYSPMVQLANKSKALHQNLHNLKNM
jgi:hypothetical protein